MKNVVNFDKSKTSKQEEVTFFFRQLSILKKLYLQGRIDKILIIAQGNIGKVSTSNRLNLVDGMEMAEDFIFNADEYIR